MRYREIEAFATALNELLDSPTGEVKWLWEDLRRRFEAATSAVWCAGGDGALSPADLPLVARIVMDDGRAVLGVLSDAQGDWLSVSVDSKGSDTIGINLRYVRALELWNRERDPDGMEERTPWRGVLWSKKDEYEVKAPPTEEGPRE